MAVPVTVRRTRAASSGCVESCAALSLPCRWVRLRPSQSPRSSRTSPQSSSTTRVRSCARASFCARAHAWHGTICGVLLSAPCAGNVPCYKRRRGCVMRLWSLPRAAPTSHWRSRAQPFHGLPACASRGSARLPPTTSAPGLGAPLPHQRRDLACLHVSSLGRSAPIRCARL